MNNYSNTYNKKINLINKLNIFKINNNIDSNISAANSVSLTSNLFKINFKENINYVIIFIMKTNPVFIQDNLLLKKLFYEQIETKLNIFFKNIFFSGNELYVMDKYIMDKQVDIQNFKYSFNINVLDTNFYIEIFYKNKIDFNTNIEYSNYLLKKYLEKFFRYILFNNKSIKKFLNDSIINIKDVKKINENNRIYKCYYTSIQITNNGLYMKINSVNKIISNLTALDKINEIKESNKGILDESKLKQKIQDYFIINRYVYDIFEKYKKYYINSIDFDKNPINTIINILNDEYKLITISIYDFYNTKYGINIKFKNQPLLEVSTNFINNNKILENKTFYLVPELVYINSFDNENDKILKRNIKYESTITPQKKLEDIFSLKNEYSKNENIKKIMEKFGINIGNNLNVSGRIISQPTLIFSNEVSVKAKDGIYNPLNPPQIFKINDYDIFYVCDKINKESVKTIFSNIINKMKLHGFQFDEQFQYNKINKYYVTTDSWERLIKDLYFIENKKYKFGFVFVNDNLYKYYYKLKNFFLENDLITQFCTLNRINIGFNKVINSIIEQIYIKIGGQIAYIDFYKESIIAQNKLYLIIGLKTEIFENNKIIYCMTSSKNKFLNITSTNIKICNNNKQNKINALTNLFEKAINQFIEYNKKLPDAIILYRKGGNYLKNIYILKEEKEVFVKLINRIQTNNNFKISFFYIVCNLSCNTKLFEINKDNNLIQFSNPKSGLIVDNTINYKNKFDFFLQTQSVTEGTATPSFYEILYIYNDEMNIEKLKKLEKLTFYLCFYYYNFKGSIREPGPLKMTEKAIDFYSICLKYNKNLFEYDFDTPIYI